MKNQYILFVQFILLTFTSGLLEICFNFTFLKSQCSIGLDENTGPGIEMFMLILC